MSLMESNFAYTEEGRAQDESTEVSFALSFFGGRTVTLTPHGELFDAARNLDQVVQLIADGAEHSDALLYSAATAIQRQEARQGQLVDDWANELAETFFGDLERR